MNFNKKFSETKKHIILAEYFIQNIFFKINKRLMKRKLI